jgi:hypothetical protein
MSTIVKQPPRVIIAIITEGRGDMALQACVSILNLQMGLMTSANGFQADLRFYKTNNEALTALYAEKDFKALYIVNFSTGVPGDFALKAWNSDKDVVIGIHPMPTIDWDRVKENIANTAESLQNTGIVYNLSLGGLPDENGYAKVKSVKAADVMFVKREALDAIVKANPAVVTKDEKHSSLFLDGVYDGVYLTGVERFVKLYGKTMYGDTTRTVNKCGPQEYIGIVGNRSQVR